jgi:hypothetical protein
VSQYGARYVERLLGVGSACALIGGIAAIDDRVRTALGNAFADASVGHLALSVDQGVRLVHSVYASVSQNPAYAPMALFGVVAAVLTLLMLRA